MDEDDDQRPETRGGRIARGLTPYAIALLALVSVEPFVAFFDRNSEQYIQVHILLQWVAVTLALVAAIYVAVLVLAPRVDPARAATALAAFVYCFFRYNALNQDDARPMAVTLGAWFVLAAVVTVTVGVWSRHEGVRFFLLLFLVGAVLLPAVSVVIHEVGEEPAGNTAAGADTEPIEVSDSTVRSPDVWWFIFDQYGRADALDSVFGYDNSPFLDELEGRGFRVSDDSYTSYPVTPLSISSVLEMDHVVTDSDEARAGFRSFTKAMRGEGRVVDAMRRHGYRYLYADNGVFDWSECNDEAADVCLPTPSTGLNVGHLTRTLGELTPLVELLSVARPDPEWTVRRAQAAMDPDEPEMVFAHVMNPHEPYWFTEDCDYRTRPVAGDFDPARYVQEIGCLNPRILDAVDAITAADPDAIVILQSDHGTVATSSMEAPLEDWDESGLADRYSILEAMRFPDQCATPEGPHSNVSTFEYVLACLEGREPEPVEERYFFWRWTAQYELTEIDRPPAVHSR